MKGGCSHFARILDEERDVLVFFYEDEDIKALSGVFKSLEVVDDVIDSKDIEFVKISDEKIEIEFAVDKLPTLVYFENKIPIEYDGKKSTLEKHPAHIVSQVT